MGQERVFKVKIDGENFFTGRDLTSGRCMVRRSFMPVCAPASTAPQRLSRA